jgi:hypothetical protein
MAERTLDLGAQDPELKNSPVVWEIDEVDETLREAMPEEPVCFFNDHAYPHGTIVKSGTARLRCDYGLWVPAGPGDPANP